MWVREILQGQATPPWAVWRSSGRCCDRRVSRCGTGPVLRLLFPQAEEEGWHDAAGEWQHVCNASFWRRGVWKVWLLSLDYAEHYQMKDQIWLRYSRIANVFLFWASKELKRLTRHPIYFISTLDMALTVRCLDTIMSWLIAPQATLDETPFHVWQQFDRNRKQCVLRGISKPELVYFCAGSRPWRRVWQAWAVATQDLRGSMMSKALSSCQRMEESSTCMKPVVVFEGCATIMMLPLT